jgi:hypothetical protein
MMGSKSLYASRAMRTSTERWRPFSTASGVRLRHCSKEAPTSKHAGNLHRIPRLAAPRGLRNQSRADNRPDCHQGRVLAEQEAEVKKDDKT